MLDCELYAEEYEFFVRYCADDEIFDLTPQPEGFNYYWWEL